MRKEKGRREKDREAREEKKREHECGGNGLQRPRRPFT